MYVVLIVAVFFSHMKVVFTGVQIFVRYHRPTGHKENLPWFWCNESDCLIVYSHPV
jgi:hypothetical protein